MIIHCSAKLVEKLPEKPPKKTVVPSLGILQNWHAHFLTLQRRQCVLFCEDDTRFMVLVKGLNKGLLQKPQELFAQLFIETLEVCCDLDYTDTDKVLDYCGPWQMDTTTDRSVQGSIRVACNDLKYYLMNRDLMETPLEAINQWLNNRPVTVKGRKDCLWPGQEMTALIQQVVLSR